MIIVLYAVWILLPVTFFSLATYAKLEMLSGSIKKHNPQDLFHQAIFLSIAVALTILVDQYILVHAVDYLPSFIPLGFLQIILLPLVLLAGARQFGGSKQIMIEGPGKNKYRRKG